MRVLATSLSALLLLLSCHAPRWQAHVRVPQTAQRNPDDCGTTALWAVLRHHKKNISYQEIYENLHIHFPPGTTPQRIVKVAQHHGMEARHTQATIPELNRWLREHTPPIVFWGPSEEWPTGHFLVVNALNTQTRQIGYLAPDGKQAALPLEHFTNRWAAGNYTTIIITPLSARALQSATN